MENSVIKKLVITLEATKYNVISNDVITSIKSIRDSLSSEDGFKLTFTTDKNEAPSNQTPIHNYSDANRHHNLSPENWDYWPV
jgi:hypothetical protein